MTDNEQTEQSDTTTRFKGDIVFKNGDKEVKATELTTVDDVKSYIQNIQTSIILDNGNETNNRKLEIRPAGLGFHVSILKPDGSESNILGISSGQISFYYNQVKVEDLYIAGNSISNVIKSTDLEKLIATDGSIYTSLAFDKKIEAILLDYGTKQYLNNNFPTYSYVNNNLVKKTDLPDTSGFITETALNSTLSSYGTKTYLQNNYPTYTYINNNLVKKTDLPDTSGFITETALATYAKSADVESKYAKKTDLPSTSGLVSEESLTTALAPYAKKTDLPSTSGLVSETALTTALADYATTESLTSTLADYAKTSSLSNYITKPESYTWSKIPFNVGTSFSYWNLSKTIMYNQLKIVDLNNNLIWQGVLVEAFPPTTSFMDEQCYTPYFNQTITTFDDCDIVLYTEAASPTIEDMYIKYKLCSEPFMIYTGTPSNDEYVLKSELNESAFKTTPANTTITHYAPIEESMNSITDFIIGSPVYLTGKVYKYINHKFVTSTATDTTDCICSVKTIGKWNEYVGICVRIDEKNKCVTFASGGDYLVKVTDTSCYGIGDEVFVDEGELKILTGQTAVTAKIRRTTVGIITTKINDTMLAVFKA